MPITLTAAVVGTLDATEKLAMIQAIVRVNGASDAGRVNKLPFDTNATIKSSYETILSEAVNSIHIANRASATDQSGLELAGFTEEQRVRVRKALIAAAQSGKSPESVVAAVEAAKP